MTKIKKEIITCAKCGKDSEQMKVYSVNYIFGNKEFNDSLVNHKQKCPYCGYEAKNISIKPKKSIFNIFKK